MENYFNYFTEIEECFQRCRGTRTLLSPLDWALVETWKEAGIPLEAVLVGVERAFEKFKKRPKGLQKVNSLAYCSQLVLKAAEEIAAGAGPEGAAQEKELPAPFEAGEIADYLQDNSAALEEAAQRARAQGQAVLAEDLAAVADGLQQGLESVSPSGDLEDVERRMTALEEKLTASLQRATDVELLTSLRADVERGLAPYRRKMTAAQVESLERQLLKKRLFEHYGIPRLSLFYL
jgi:triphosphoribosyl-dephospho-CoA synthetase